MIALLLDALCVFDSVASARYPDMPFVARTYALLNDPDEQVRLAAARLQAAIDRAAAEIRI